MARVVDAGEIDGVRVVTLRPFADARGRFLETFRQEWFPGRPAMLQQNRSDSAAGVLRGLHFHHRQADYWYVQQGGIFAALADLRRGSRTRGCVATVGLGAELAAGGADLGLYIPPGVAHGFYAVTRASMTYLVDRTYDPKDELGVAWDDPDLGVAWPLHGAPILSDRDRANPRLADIAEADLPA